VKQHGDPRAANVDAVDWVERIPFAETRNYVQRVMENLQVYRVRFDPGAPIISELDAHPSAPEANAASILSTPTSVSER
jgi:soluble lytic murein transglycosylase